MIKLIASDMDGTLLDSKKNLPKDLHETLHALKAQQVDFVIASGRQYAALRRDLTEYVPEAMFIAENGALVMERDVQLFIDPLNEADLLRIVRACQGISGVFPVVCRAGVALVERTASQEFIEHLYMYYAEAEVVDDLEAACAGLTDVCKVAFYDEGDAATGEYPILKEKLGDTLAVILSGANWVDIMKPGVDKGRAMRMIQKIKGVKPEESMAFGDYLNDKELLESVGESYAMANALPEIRAIAKHIAPSNDENGVLRVIRERVIR